MARTPVLCGALGGRVAQGCYEMHPMAGGVITGEGGAVMQSPHTYINKINGLAMIIGEPVVSDAVHDPAISVTHFKLREAELIMAKITTADALSPDGYAAAEPVIRILSPAQRLAPAATAVAGTVR